MKRACLFAVAFVVFGSAFSQMAEASGVCGLSLAEVEEVGTAAGSQRLNDAVARAFLNKFNNTGPVTRYQAPVWVIDRPRENVLEFIATVDGRGCAFIAPGDLRQMILKMIYGEAA
jgi:hypothetical protein